MRYYVCKLVQILTNARSLKPTMAPLFPTLCHVNSELEQLAYQMTGHWHIVSSHLSSSFKKNSQIL